MEKLENFSTVSSNERARRRPKFKGFAESHVTSDPTHIVVGFRFSELRALENRRISKTRFHTIARDLAEEPRRYVLPTQG